MNIPIKILCGCGQKYAFDVELADARRLCPVQCPVCGASGAAAAEQALVRYLTSGADTTPSGQPGRTTAPPCTPPLPPPTRPRALRGRATARGGARIKWLFPALGGFGATIVALAGSLVFGGGCGQKHDAVATATANDGLPHSLAELNAWYATPPAAENAALFVAQGLEALQMTTPGSASLPLVGQGQLPPLGAPIPPAVKSALVTFARANRPALEFFAQSAALDASRYPLDLSRGDEAPLPHLHSLNLASQVVKLTAILDSDNHDGRQAARDIGLGLALARSLDAEPVLISQLLRVALTALAVSALEETVNRVTLPAESLVELSKTIERMEKFDSGGEGFKRALAAERISSLALLDNPQKLLQLIQAPGVMDLADDLRVPVVARLKKGGSLKAEQEYFQQSFRQVTAARKETYPDRLKSDALVRSRASQALEKKLAVAAVVMRWLNVSSKEAFGLAHLRLGQTAIALEQFRAAHQNHYPTALSELAPDILAAPPEDPFDGQPLRYRQQGRGYLLYSVGTDLKDDSGTRGNAKEGDFVFEVVTPPKT